MLNKNKYCVWQSCCWKHIRVQNLDPYCLCFLNGTIDASLSVDFVFPSSIPVHPLRFVGTVFQCTGGMDQLNDFVFRVR